MPKKVEKGTERDTIVKVVPNKRDIKGHHILKE
jgi:hypothetical protein